MRVFESTRTRLGSAALAVTISMLGWAGAASAAPCMGDAAGDPDLNCTAQDLGVASVTVTNILDDGCTSVGDSFTFDGTLNIEANTTTRYDLGFYIGADSIQAVTGSCSVNLIPPAGATQIDDDSCGDSPKDTAQNVPVSNVTAVCNDANGDGFFDLAICASYDNNNQDNCNGVGQLIPGTSAKCQCAQIETNVEIPECATNEECGADANVCTDAVCLGIGQPGADAFGCGQVNNTVPCDDTLFCNGTDVCSGGTCGHSGDPCTGGGACEDCNEAAGNCFDAAGTTCRAANGVCDQAETCSGSSVDCPANDFLDSGVCRAQDGICDVAESCDGNSANCPVDGFVNEGTTCRAQDGECDIREECLGSNGACPVDGFVTGGEPCSTDGNVCTDDVCDGTGDCDHNDNSDPCDDAAFCTVNDICSAGSCAGTPRDCSDAIECTDDSCNEAGDACANTPNNGNCEDDNNCTADVCSIEAAGCVFNFTCTTDICRSPGYWATHSGYEKLPKSVNVGQLVLDAAGPLEVCGQTITATSNADPLFLDGLGLTSDLEGLCMRARGVKQRQLYRQLVAAGMNCLISGGDCDSILGKYVDVSFSDCSDLCAGNPVVDGPSVGECVGNLDCFNNGGQMIDDVCVKDLPGNCHETPLCNEGLGVCPKSTPASSPNACKEARFNGCTIDSCN